MKNVTPLKGHLIIDAAIAQNSGNMLCHALSKKVPYVVPIDKQCFGSQPICLENNRDSRMKMKVK